MLLSGIALSVAMIVTGAVTSISTALHKQTNTLAKAMLVQGIIWIGVHFLFFFLFSFSLSFFGLSATASGLPKIEPPYETNTGFPVEDLEIVSVQQTASGSAEQPVCEITVKNNNASIAVTNILFGSASSNESITFYSDIPPSSASAILIKGEAALNLCDQPSIRDAGMIVY